ncbi:MAG: hypothetical protein LBC83_04610 [Oscillospiraceae bacterium]|nr:hypothetical protein [Oscillospiraceae bacterium]
MVLAGVVVAQGKGDWRDWERWQKNHVDRLAFSKPQSNEAALSLERSRTGLDVAAAIANGTKLNRLRGILTHNSYKQKMSPVSSVIYDSLHLFGSGRKGEYEYTFPPLSAQLSSGVCGLELDVNYTKNADGSPRFLFFHAPLLDMNSSAIDAQLAMREIAVWSENNPMHLPVIILLEPKSASIPLLNLYGFDSTSLSAFDEMLRDSFGSALLTPADFLKDYPNFAAMRADDAWPLLQDTLGKIIVLLHPSDVSEEYIQRDETLKTQAMFPVFVWQKGIDNPNASFVLASIPREAYEKSAKLIGEENFIVRSRLDSWPEHTEEEYRLCMESGAQWLSTDYPKCVGNEYVAAFPGGSSAEILG